MFAHVCLCVACLVDCEGAAVATEWRLTCVLRCRCCETLRKRCNELKRARFFPRGFLGVVASCVESGVIMLCGLLNSHFVCVCGCVGDVGVIDADALLFGLWDADHCIDWRYGGQVRLCVAVVGTVAVVIVLSVHHTHKTHTHTHTLSVTCADARHTSALTLSLAHTRTHLHALHYHSKHHNSQHSLAPVPPPHRSR